MDKILLFLLLLTPIFILASSPSLSNVKKNYDSLKYSPFDYPVTNAQIYTAYTDIKSSSFLLNNTSLDEFFSTVVANDGPHSVPRFDKTVQHPLHPIPSRNVSATPWDSTNSRTISLIHTITNPLAPVKECSVSKTQQFFKDATQIVISTRTKTAGVPGSDAFHVDIIEIAKPLPSDPSTLSIECRYNIKFTSWTSLKFFINKDATRDTGLWLRSFYSSLTNFLHDANEFEIAAKGNL